MWLKGKNQGRRKQERAFNGSSVDLNLLGFLLLQCPPSYGTSILSHCNNLLSSFNLYFSLQYSFKVEVVMSSEDFLEPGTYMKQFFFLFFPLDLKYPFRKMKSYVHKQH